MESKRSLVFRVSILTLGFSSIFTQVYLLREFLAVFNGNELVMGIVLANWMLITGFGAWLGRFFPRLRGQVAFILFLQLILAILPLLTVLKLDLWRSIVIPYGSMPGIMDILYASFLVQLPFCILNGFLFTAYSSLLSGEEDRNMAPAAYALESLGSGLAGLVVNLLLLWFFGTFMALKCLVVLQLAVAVYFAVYMASKLAGHLAAVFAMLVLVALLFLDLGRFSDTLFYRDQQIVFSGTTPYGNVVVTEQAGQRNVYENGLPLFSSGNEILSEEAVHYALAQRPHPANILLISGGISGTIPEVLKYKPARIDHVELNPALLEIGEKYAFETRTPAVHSWNMDGRRFLDKTTVVYDAVLLSLPGPSTLQINRYYTLEFFKKMKKHLGKDGVVSVSLASSADYVSREASALNSSLYHTLETVFRYVLILPGQKNYFLASDAPLDPGIAALVDARGIDTKFVNRYYLDDGLFKDRSDFIKRQLSKDAPLNQDFRPAAFFLQLRYWAAHFRVNFLAVLVIMLVIALFMVRSLNRISLGMFTGGFTAASLEVLVLLSVQVAFGYVFSMAGVIITLFMAGMAAGAFFRRHVCPNARLSDYRYLQLTIALFTAGFPFLMIFLSETPLPGGFVITVFCLLSLVVSILVGMEFSVASALSGSDAAKGAAGNYSADLFGSAVGAILTTILLFPLLGIVAACLVIAFLNAFSALLLFREKVNADGAD
jgi:spermidine synthase